jgi:hypothetical protein
MLRISRKTFLHQGILINQNGEIDKIFRRDSSETVWRQERKAVTIWMDSLVPDLTKVTKSKRF